MNVGSRHEALVAGGRRGRVGELGDRAGRIGRRDVKAEAHLPSAACALQHGVDHHALAFLEGLIGHEGAAIALEVAIEVTVVVAALRAHHRDILDVGDRRAQEADLGMRVGRIGLRRRRYVNRGAGQRGGVIERGRQTHGRGSAGPNRGACAGEGSRAEHHRNDHPREDREGDDDEAQLQTPQKAHRPAPFAMPPRGSGPTGCIARYTATEAPCSGPRLGWRPCRSNARKRLKRR